MSANYATLISGNADLVSFWRMGDATGATVFDDSKATNDATLNGGITLEVSSSYIVGDSSKAATFNGTSGYASIGNVSALNFTRTSPFTISAIVKPNVTRSGANTDYWIYTKANSSSPFQGLLFGLKWNGSATRVQAFFIANYPTQSIRKITSTTDLANATEYLVTLTYDGSAVAAGLKIYVNGVVETLIDDPDAGGAPSQTIAAGQDTTTTTNAEIARRNSLNKWFNGTLKDLAIFSAAKTAGLVYLFFDAAKQTYSSIAYTVPSPRPQVFYDFDMDSDVDDVVDAVTLLSLERRREIDIVGAVSTSADAKSAPCWLAIANYYGRATIPTGVNTSAPGSSTSGLPWHVFTTGTAATYAVPGKTDAANFDTYLTTQRSVLAAAADNSIEYITTGDLSSVKGLLDSSADGYSALNGVALVALKVRHLWIVGGYWPSGAAVSDVGGAPSVSNSVLTTWPTTVPIIFENIHDGDTVYSGENVMVALSSSNPARAAWELFWESGSASNKREAWSQLAILSIARGVYPNSLGTDYNGLLGGAGTGAVNASTGVTSWDYTTQSNHGFMYKILADASFTTAINALLIEPVSIIPVLYRHYQSMRAAA